MLDNPKRISLFWSKVEKGRTDDCWEWQGHKDKEGYGLFGNVMNGRKRSGRRANRYALSLKLGRWLTRDEMACHSCDNPGCTNPRHLFLGNAAVNNGDAFAKGRYSHGERHCISKLNEGAIRKIVALRMKGTVLNKIAAKFKISRGTVSRLFLGQSWRHLDIPKIRVSKSGKVSERR